MTREEFYSNLSKASDGLNHSGVDGQKYGKRLYQNPDGTWTELGKERRRAMYKSKHNTKRKGLFGRKKVKEKEITVYEKPMSQKVSEMTSEQLKKESDRLKAEKDYYDAMSNRIKAETSYNDLVNPKKDSQMTKFKQSTKKAISEAATKAIGEISKDVITYAGKEVVKNYLGKDFYEKKEKEKKEKEKKDKDNKDKNKK